MSSLISKLFRRKKPVEQSGYAVVNLGPETEFPRPAGGYVPMSVLGVARLPIYILPFRFAYDLAYNSDILRTVIRALVSETFRNGLRIKPAYVKKCSKCGAEFHEDVEMCPVCGNTTFIVPNEENRQWLRRVMSDCNLNNESLIDVLMSVSFDINTTDNGYLVVLKKYYFDENGNLVGAEPKEILRADPRYMRLVMSRDGRPATVKDKIAVFCLEHRDTYHLVTKEELERGEARCPVCGKQMFPAYYQYMRSGKTIYYTNGEVLHIKKFTYGVGYGYPPVMSIWMKLLILMRQDYFILMAYHLQRSPRGLLIIKSVNRESVEKAWQYLMEKARINPHMVYPLVIEADRGMRNVAEWIDLSFRNSDIDFIQYRAELRRTIAALYGVTPIYMSEPGGSGRDTMQVLVTNRAVEMEQRLFNEKVLPWLVKQLGVDDWRIEVAPVEMRDEMTMLRIAEEKLKLARMLAELGYDVKVKLNERGELDIVFTPAEKPIVVDVGSGESSKERYYRESFKRQKLQGEPTGAWERPRSGEQRAEGEPQAVESVEGEPKVGE